MGIKRHVTPYSKTMKLLLNLIRIVAGSPNLRANQSWEAWKYIYDVKLLTTVVKLVKFFQLMLIFDVLISVVQKLLQATCPPPL